MVRKSPKTPKRDFTIKFKGKTVKFIASDYDSGGEERWRGQIYCPWYCGRLLVAVDRKTPKMVKEVLEVTLENHWNIQHRS